jgi:hypothetical protein
MILITGAMIFIACILLAMCQKKNWYLVTKRTNRNSHVIRYVGFSLLASSIIFCSLDQGISYTVLLWPLLFLCASFMVSMTLSFKPQWLRPVASLLTKQ